MGGDLHSALLNSGAVIDGASRCPLHFGAPKAELHAALNVCAVADRSNLARLCGDGADLPDLLHRLSTQALTALPPGHGTSTVLTTNKGRIVERLFVSRLDEARLLLIGGPDRASAILEHLNKYTFAEQTGLADRGADQAFLTLSGPQAREALVLSGFEAPEPLGAVEGSHDGIGLHVVGHDGYSADGYGLLVPNEQAGSLWQALVLAVAKTDGRPAGRLALEAARVRRGIPAPGAELSEDFNPLEAGLWDAVSFDKGCYVGQEVVARLNTYDKVSRRLVGLRLPEGQLVVAGGTHLFRDDKDIGIVTSLAELEGVETVGLGYVKTRAADVGDTVRIGAADGPEVELEPFPMHG